MVEQGLSFTVIVAPHPLEGEPGSWNARRDFISVQRVWLGVFTGTDWLHEAAEHEFASHGWHAVESGRRSTHTGAAGEVATVVLVLMGADVMHSFLKAFAQRAGESSADAVLEWARQRVRDRGTPHDPSPNFHERDVDGLARGLASELADLLRIPMDRLELVKAERCDGYSLVAVYRDGETGREYAVEAGRDSATFRRVEP